MNKLFYSGLFLLCILSFTLSNPVYAQIGLRSVGVNIGLYTPQMDYWNDNALSTWGEKFGSGLAGDLNLHINVISIFGVRAGIGYWNQELTESGIQYGDELRSDKLSIQMIPLNFDLIIRSPEELSDLFGFYGGIGSGINFISMEYGVNIPSLGETIQNHSGKNMLFHLIVGADYKVMNNLAVGAEFKYVFAKYTQEIQSGANLFEEKVSISGPKIMATFKYLF